MADVHDKATRSFNMSQIKGKDTRPEMIVRRYLHARGFRYKLHDRTLPGKPDLVLPKYRTAIFIHGCFWHGHKDCSYFVIPKTRTEWWLSKINRNIANDLRAIDSIRNQDWQVIVIWECSLKGQNTVKTLTKLPGKICNFRPL